MGAESADADVVRHLWDFRGSKGDVTDKFSKLVAHSKGAKPTEDGVSFDGKGAYVEIDPWPWGGAVSFEVLVKLESITEWGRIFDFCDSNHNNEVSLLERFSTPECKFVLFPGNLSLHGGTDFWKPGIWQHVVTTVSGSTLCIYLDGELKAKLDNGNEPTMTQREHHWIGRGPDRHGGGWLHGTIAYLSIYHGTALDAAKVQTLYAESRAQSLLNNSASSRVQEFRKVGQSQLSVPVLGLGCSPLGEVWDEVPPMDALRALEAAYGTGIRHFDTAPWYGNGMSESRVGLALNSIRKARDSFSVSTKVGRTLDPAPRKNDGPWDGLWHGGFNLQVRYDYSYEGVLQQHRESCLRMGLQRVDALAIHDLDAMFGGQELVDKYLAQLRPPGGFRALQELKERGEVKAIGIGCNPYKFGSREVCTAVADMGALDYIIFAGPYNLLNQEALDDLLPLCEEKRISIFVGAPFASGILITGSKGREPRYMYEPASAEMIAKVKEIEEVCTRHDVTLPAAALQFPLAHPRVACVLSGVKSEEEVRCAMEAMDEEIPSAFWQELKDRRLIRQDAPTPGDRKRPRTGLSD